MQKNKFIQIFFDLPAHEKVAFKKWVHSPFYNPQAELRRLFDYIYEVDFVKSRDALAREALFTSVFPERPYQLSKLRYWMTDLMRLLEQFLVYQYRKQSEFDFQLDLAAAYAEMNIEDLSKQALGKIELWLEKTNLRNIDYWEAKYNYERQYYQLSILHQRSEAPKLQQLNDDFDIAYLSGKLKHACRILSYEGMYKKQYNTGLLHQVLHYITENPKILELPAVGMYYYYYQAVVSSGEESTGYFQAFKSYLFQYESMFPLAELRDLYKLALNYSIKGLNKANQEYYVKETFDLYSRALAQNILIENGQISPFAFSNIVAVALGLGLDEWTDSFIEKYSVFLEKDLYNAQYNYNRAKLCFYRKDFKAASYLLSADDFDDLHLNLSAKVLLLKTYYHLDEFQLLDALVHRFKIFLNRQKTLGYHKQNYHNILRYMRRLVALNPYSKKEKEKLYKEIEGTELLTEKSWFLAQL